MKRLGLAFLLLASGLRAAPAAVLLAAATAAEMQPLLDRLAGPKTEQIAAWQFWTGTLDGRPVVLARTEGDPLNAVAATTLAIRRYQPRLVVTFGPARAHDPALRAGDVVVSGKFAAFDGLFSHPAPVGGGSAPLTWERLPHQLSAPGEKEIAAFTFPADAAALQGAKNLTHPPGRVVVGVLGSANQVNREADRIAWLHREWGTSCEDGESAHIAGCAQLLGVPVIGVRVIDGAPGDAAGLVRQLLEALP
jgi:adenosylhomocysteine nucleosidase